LERKKDTASFARILATPARLSDIESKIGDRASPSSLLISRLEHTKTRLDRTKKNINKGRLKRTGGSTNIAVAIPPNTMVKVTRKSNKVNGRASSVVPMSELNLLRILQYKEKEGKVSSEQ
jgi:hypothetical protein